MSAEVKIPAVGESISSGVVSVWHKKSGEYVNAGDALFTLETDKVSTEIVAEQAGVLETKVPEGQEVKIGEVVATIDDSKSAPAEAAPGDKKPAATGDGSKASSEPEERSAASQVLSPAVRRIVEEEKVDTSRLSGTGKGGRLTKGDVLAAAENRGEVAVPAALVGKAEVREAPSQEGRVTRRKMSPLRRKIAAHPRPWLHTLSSSSSEERALVVS